MILLRETVFFKIVLSFLPISAAGSFFNFLKRSDNQLRSVVIPYVNENKPHTAISLFGISIENTTIVLCDQNDRAVYTYPEVFSKDTYYIITIVTERNGFRIFDYGEDVAFAKVNISRVSKLFVSELGLASAYMSTVDPVWAFYKEHMDEIIISDFSPVGMPVPAGFVLVQKGIYKVHFGDYLMISGELSETAEVVEIVMNSTLGIAMSIKLRLKEEPFLQMSTIIDDQQKFVDTSSDRNILDKPKFSIHLMCEHLGWRLYINGLDYHFFYYRLPPQAMQNILLYGEPEESWKILKFTQKYTK